MEDVFIEGVVHTNSFKFLSGLSDEDREKVFGNLIMSEGNILGAKYAKLKPFFEEPEIRKVRRGILKFPTKMEVKSEDDFFRFIALLVPLDEVP